MTVVSVNIGKIQNIGDAEKSTPSGICKIPVDHRLKVGKLGIEGDEIADLTVHGGEEKAVYAYPQEHYQFWENELNHKSLSPGIFGENLTITGHLESDVFLGDIFKIGTAKLQVTIPRQPCHKLNLKFKDNTMVKRFTKAGKSGFYLKVIEEGYIQSGDDCTNLNTLQDGLSILEFNQLYSTDQKNIPLLKKALSSSFLPERYRIRFEERLNNLEANTSN